MPLKFTCPHCKKNLSVKEEFAGKRGTCPACKKLIVVPNKATRQAAAPVRNKLDLESLAAETLAEKKQSAAAATIEVTCSWCDHVFKAPADLAGKQSPCPECRRIVKVPVPKEGAADWRAAAVGPTGAVRKIEALQGEWGSETARGGVSREALEEAGALPIKIEPTPLGYWLTRVAVLLLALGAAGGGIWYWLHYRAGRYETLGLAMADQAFAKDRIAVTPPEAQAELHRLLGEYYTRTDARDASKRTGLQRLQAAREALVACKNPIERVGLARSLIRTQIELNLPAGEITPCLAHARPRSSDEARLIPDIVIWRLLRETARLVLAKEGEDLGKRQAKIVSCVLAGYPAVEIRIVAAAKPSPKPPPNQPEPEPPPTTTKQDHSAQLACLAIVAQELLRLGHKENALALLKEYYDQRLADSKDGKFYPAEGDPLPYPLEVVLLMLNKPLPKGMKPRSLARIEAAARAGNDEVAKKLTDELFAAPTIDRLIALLHLVDSPKLSDKQAKEYLKEAFGIAVKDPKEAQYHLAMIVGLAISRGYLQEAAEWAEKLLAGPELGRAGLEILRLQLREQQDTPADKGKASPLRNGGIAYYVALAELARHNARLDAKETFAWTEEMTPLEKSFTGVGVALGMRDARVKPPGK